MGKGYYIGSCFQGNICRIRVKTIQARFIGVGRFRILGGPRGGQIRSRHMTS